MILASIAGLLIMAGMLVVVRGAFPPPPPLSEVLTQFHQDRAAPDRSTAPRTTRERLAVSLAQAIHGDLEDKERDLRVSGLTLESEAIAKVNASLSAAVLAVLLVLLTGAVSSPLFVLVVLALGAATGYLLPDIQLRTTAKERRAEFDQTVGAFLELVSVSVAGGSNPNTAINDTVAMGRGWAFDMLRTTVNDTRLRGETPWVGLERLGREIGVDSLVELAGAMSLAGGSGARIATTLISRAEAAREKDLSQRLGEAESKSEVLGVPVVLMILGWTGFLGYPAILNLIGS